MSSRLASNSPGFSPTAMSTLTPPLSSTASSASSSSASSSSSSSPAFAPFSSYSRSPPWRIRSFLSLSPSARSGATLTLLNHGRTGILIGGNGRADLCADYILFDVSTLRAVSLCPLEKIDRRVGHSSIHLYNNIYIFGGWNGKKYLSTAALFDVESENLLLEDNKSRVPVATAASASAASSSASASASAPPPLPNARRDHTMTRFGSTCYLFGGWDCDEEYNDLWAVERRKGHWVWSPIDCIAAECPAPRRGHSAAKWGNRLIVFGGIYGYSKYLNDLWVFDTSTLQWSRPAVDGDAPAPRAWHSAVACGADSGLILIFGGTSGRHAFYNDLYLLNLQENRWQCLFTSSANASGVPAPRCAHSAMVSGNQMFVFGGLSPGPPAGNGNGAAPKITPMNDLWTLELPFEVSASDDEDDDNDSLTATSETALDDDPLDDADSLGGAHSRTRSASHNFLGGRSLHMTSSILSEILSELTIPDADADGAEDGAFLDGALAAKDNVGAKLQLDLVEFSKTVFSEENVLFFLGVERFKDDTTPTAAKTLFEQYLQVGAASEIHVPNRVREEIATNLSNTDKAGKGLFDAAQKYALNIIRTEILPKWLESLKTRKHALGK